MKAKIFTGARLLLGLFFFVFGLNGFLQFLPQPPLPEAAMNFFMAMVSTGYLVTFVKATEVVGGLLLLTGFAAPVALLMLAPITLNILFFHLFLTPGLENAIMPLVMVALHFAAAQSYCSLFRPLFKTGFGGKLPDGTANCGTSNKPAA